MTSLRLIRRRLDSGLIICDGFLVVRGSAFGSSRRTTSGLSTSGTTVRASPRLGRTAPVLRGLYQGDSTPG